MLNVYDFMLDLNTVELVLEGLNVRYNLTWVSLDELGNLDELGESDFLVNLN